MKFGDIDNRPVPALGMRFEGIIKVGGQLNRAAKSFLYATLNKDISLHLVTLLDERKVRAFNYKYGVPYNGVIHVDSVLEIAEICEEHSFLVYYDTDPRVLETIGTRGGLRTEAREWTAEEFR